MDGSELGAIVGLTEERDSRRSKVIQSFDCGFYEVAGSLRRVSCKLRPLAFHKILIVVVRRVGVMMHGLFEAVFDGWAEHVVEAGVAGLFVDRRHLHILSVALHGFIWADDVALVDLVGELLSCLSCWVGLVIKWLMPFWFPVCFRMELDVIVDLSTCSCHLYLDWFACICIVIVILRLKCSSFGVMSCCISIIFLLFWLVLLRLGWIQRIRIISQSLSPICRQFLSLLTFQLPLPPIYLIEQPIFANG